MVLQVYLQLLPLVLSIRLTRLILASGVLNAAGISTQDVCTIPMEVNLNVSAASNSNLYNGQLGVNIVGGVSPFSVTWMNGEEKCK